MGSTSISNRFRRFVAVVLTASAATFLAVPPAAAQVESSAELADFQSRLDSYIALHRKLEGPLPPIMVTSDMDEVHRLMDALRARLKAARGAKGRQGSVITPRFAVVLRQVVGSTLTLADIVNVSEELAEHTPPRMPRVRVNEPLPQDAPFVMLAPQLLKALPQLPEELRYVALGGALIIWDHHANLVVEIAPRLFDPLTYSNKKSLTTGNPR